MNLTELEALLALLKKHHVTAFQQGDLKLQLALGGFGFQELGDDADAKQSEPSDDDLLYASAE